MQFLQFLSLLQKRGLSYAIYEISFSPPKTWTIICNFWNFFIFLKNMVSHMQFLEFLSLLQNHGLLYMKLLDFLSLLQNCGLSYAISRISFASPNTWPILC